MTMRLSDTETYIFQELKKKGQDQKYENKKDFS